MDGSDKIKKSFYIPVRSGLVSFTIVCIRPSIIIVPPRIVAIILLMIHTVIRINTKTSWKQNKTWLLGGVFFLTFWYVATKINGNSLSKIKQKWFPDMFFQRIVAIILFMIHTVIRINTKTSWKTKQNMVASCFFLNVTVCF